MKKFNLTTCEHKIVAGNKCPALQPNVTEDCVFYLDGNPVGFYKRKVEGKLKGFIDIANSELRSKNVPKTMMSRGVESHLKARGIELVQQYSTIIGSIPPKPHMKREYPTRSSVHLVKTAQTFVKAMLLAARESEAMIKEIMPEQYEKQKKILSKTKKEWRFSELFTSSISNYNISAPFHRDTGNLKETLNIIITKRRNSTGGNLNVPDYGITVDQCDGSLLAYPAWLNIHGVTPIEKTFVDGYRNSLIFYPLKAFEKY